MPERIVPNLVSELGLFVLLCIYGILVFGWCRFIGVIYGIWFFADDIMAFCFFVCVHGICWFLYSSLCACDILGFWLRIVILFIASSLIVYDLSYSWV